MNVQARELAALVRTRDAHVAAVNAGDADAWVGCFGPDGVQMPPNEPSNVGAEAIRAWSGAFLSAFRAEFSLSPDQLEQAGPDWAFERGAYSITLTPRAGGNPIHDAGKYLTIYRRQAGDVWTMASDIWNTDSPPLGSS